MANVEKLVGFESPLEVGQKINEIIEKGVGGGNNLFDTKLSDHILEGEKALGWALQGTYVYKDAVAGSREGYPDFYNKCLEEKDTATATEITLGENTITMYIHANGHQFYDVANKDVIDAWFDTYGFAWFYGIDTENERVFLPRNNYFEQVTGDNSEVGLGVEAGLPNITGTFKTRGGAAAATGAVYLSGTAEKANYDDGSTNASFALDASLSSAIYGKSDTVQPNAVKKLLYICVGNTEVISTVTDVVEVTTTENDTIPLFTAQYFDFTPNNVSWLKAGEQANVSNIYTTAYNELVNCLNGVNKYNLKVINTSDMVSGVDYSEYWKVNQTDMTFSTPSTAGLYPNNRILVAKKEATDSDNTWFNLYSDGWLEQGGITSGSSVNFLKSYKDTNYSITSTFYQATADLTKTGHFFAISKTTTGMTRSYTSTTVIWETKGYAEIPTISDYTENVNLYFKVANAVQNLELLDAGAVLEAVADKISHQDCKAYIVETYNNGASGYNLYSNGYCEQWGTIQNGATVGSGKSWGADVTLLLPMVNTDYNILLTYGYGTSTSSAAGHEYRYQAKTNSSFVAEIYNRNGSTTIPNTIEFNWEVSGYIA